MDQDSKKPAVAPTWVRDAVGSARAEPYHIWKPRPLLRSVLWEPATKGDAPRRSNSAYETFLVQRALDVLFSHVWSSPHETSSFGFLVGDLCECPDSGGRYVIVNTAIPSRFPLKEDAEPQISTEAKIALQLEVDRHKGILVGWYHSHPKGPPRLSNQDLTTHRSIFKEPWHTAVLVTTDRGKPEGAVFCQTDEGMDSQLLPFYEQVSNESLMAKGRKRTRIDWQNFVTDTSILSDIAPRPDVPKPPGEDSKAEEEAAQKAAALEAEQAAEAAQAVAEAEAAKVAEEERARVAAQEAEKAAALEAEEAAKAAEEEAAQKAAALETEQAAEAAQAVAEAEAAKVAEEERARVAAQEAEKAAALEAEEAAQAAEEEAAGKAAALEAEQAAEAAQAVAEAEAAKVAEEERARVAAQEAEKAAALEAEEAAKAAEEEAARQAAALEAEKAAEDARVAKAEKAAALEAEKVVKAAAKAAAKAEKAQRAAVVAEEKRAARAAKKAEKDAKAATLKEEKIARAAALEAEKAARAAEVEAERAARALEEENSRAAALEAGKTAAVATQETAGRPPPPRRKVAGGARSMTVPQRYRSAPRPAPERDLKIAALATDKPERAPAEAPAGRARGLMLGAAGLLIVVAVLGALVTVVRSGEGDALTGGGADPVEDFVTPTEDGRIDLASGSESGGAEATVEGSGATTEATTNADQISRAGFEALGDNMLAVISVFYGQALRRDQGRTTCAQLQAAFVSVEEGWISYNVEGKARFSERLTGDLLERDDRLYAGVQDVEREFDRSRCARP